MDDPYTMGQAFDDAYPVDGKWWVRGTMDPSDPKIYFRIGLKSELPGGATAAPRYGLVLLTYKNNTMQQRIWIRQGEAEDYLMRPGDVIASGPLAGKTRAAAAKFSPYNLTAQTLDAIVDAADPDPSQKYGNPTEFVRYPSQAGALFQYYGVSSSRLVYKAHQIQPGVSAGRIVGSNTIWSNYNLFGETCPAGYRRPSNGPIDELAEASATGIPAETDEQLALSEMQLSLMLNPQSGIYDEAGLVAQGNYNLGRYADGFFYRRLAGNDPTGERSNSTVSVSSRDIAYTGGVFYNPKTYASIFFPKVNRRGELNAAGNAFADFELHAAGTGDQYYQSASINTLGVWALAGYPSRGYGMAIRCVKDEFVSSSGINLDDGAWNGVE